jgi:hypothetical protein
VEVAVRVEGEGGGCRRRSAHRVDEGGPNLDTAIVEAANHDVDRVRAVRGEAEEHQVAARARCDPPDHERHCDRKCRRARGAVRGEELHAALGCAVPSHPRGGEASVARRRDVDRAAAR